MDWFLQVFVFGALALAFFLFSLALLKRKQNIAGLAAGMLELLSGTVSCGAWMWALKVSGKTDWLLLGLLRYTPIALVFYAMMSAGVLCVFLNLRSLKRTRTENGI